ncbi:MAG: type II toxin-antitoxin system prevent-host-death family antitoxin [Acidobacteria bacterium]|nr:type II toxin-antitoxin system prevent-host-death family antitoxin [Acidobacteriota bacterium]
MLKTIGSRELKTRLGTYLRAVREGATLVITDRGRPVAELRPLSAMEDEEGWLQDLVATGAVSRPKGRPQPAPERIRITGPPISGDLREDRF